MYICKMLFKPYKNRLIYQASNCKDKFHIEVVTLHTYIHMYVISAYIGGLDFQV